MAQNHNKASLAIHAFVDNLDNAHYDASDRRLEYNLGEIIQNGFFSDVEIVIVEAQSFSIRAAKMKSSGKFAIVIQTPTLPEIGKVDDFIEHSKVSIPLIKELAKIATYLDDTRVGGAPDIMTDYEKAKKFNEKEFFEQAYMAGVEKMNQFLSRLAGQIKSLEQKAENSGLASRKSTYVLAIQKLKDETIGEDEKKFTSKFYDLLEDIHSGFKKHIDSTNKKRLESRISQFYKKVASTF